VEVAKLFAQLDNFKTTKDGGSKLTIEFGLESFEEVKKVITWSSQGKNLVVVITPFKDKENLIDRDLD
jgi:hypothetical protein